MTPRERNLLRLLLVVLAAAALLFGLSAYFDGLSRLDAQFITLQKRALRLTQAVVLTKSSESAASFGDLKERFYAPGSLPDPLALAARVQAVAKTEGLGILESRVTENTPSAQWVQYHAEADIEAWFRFLQVLRREDPRTLFRTLSLVKKQGFSYAIVFEVGHVVLP